MRKIKYKAYYSDHSTEIKTVLVVENLDHALLVQDTPISPKYYIKKTEIIK